MKSSLFCVTHRSLSTRSIDSESDVVDVPGGRGRKLSAVAHNYFDHDVKKNVAVCNIEECKAVLKGRNSANMEARLRKYHKDFYDTVFTKELDKAK